MPVTLSDQSAHERLETMRNRGNGHGDGDVYSDIPAANGPVDWSLFDALINEEMMQGFEESAYAVGAF